MKKLIALVVLAAMLAVTGIGCSGGTTTGSKGPATSPAGPAATKPA